MQKKLPRLLVRLVLVFATLTLILPLRAENPSDFTLKSATSDAIFSLASTRGKYVALHFLLKTECPYCLRHTRDYFTKSSGLPDVIQVFVKPDTEAEISSWAKKLTADELAQHPIFRDPDAALAKAFAVPDGYHFHGQVVHFPATILLDRDGREIFRHVGKNNSDRLPFEKLAEKINELASR